jgi:hypothetical protein
MKIFLYIVCSEEYKLTILHVINDIASIIYIAKKCQAGVG